LWYLVQYEWYSFVCSSSTLQCLVLGAPLQISLLPSQSVAAGALAGKDTLRSDVETDHGEKTKEEALQAVGENYCERENVDPARKVN